MSDLADDPVPRQRDGDSPVSLIASLSPSVRCFALLRVASICALPPPLDRLLQVRRRPCGFQTEGQRLQLVNSILTLVTICCRRFRFE